MLELDSSCIIAQRIHLALAHYELFGNIPSDWRFGIAGCVDKAE